MFTIKSKLTVAFSALFFLIGAATFTVQNALAFTADDPDDPVGDNPCYHCGTVEACEDGGQPYGYTNCEIDDSEWGNPNVCDLSDFYCEEV